MAILSNEEIKEIKEDAEECLADKTITDDFVIADCEVRIDLIETIEALLNKNCNMKALEFNGGWFHNCSKCGESYGFNKSFDGNVFKYCPNCSCLITEWK